MKKLFMFVLLAISVTTLSGCGLFGGNDDFEPDRIKLDGECDGMSDYVVVNGECLDISEMLSDSIRINSDGTVVSYMNSVELMEDFVADLTGSTGLAVVSRDIYEDQIDTGSPSLLKLMKMAADTQEEDPTENLIVKLREDGFFEEVDFETEGGQQVDITSNPLALEVFGPWTIVVFEVDLDWYDENYQPDFSQKVWDSLYAGGIYLIHNETGKMFATKEVTYQENTYTYTEDHSRMIHVNVTLNEPVVELQDILRVDDDGHPVLDENGNEIYDPVPVPLKDGDGNPIIFTEGPILTEMVEVPLVEYYKVQQVDGDGNPVFDENGNPVYDIVEEAVLDDNGDPIIEMQEVAVTDENGNVVYQQNFEMELWVEDIRDITVTEYYAQVSDNPISEVAQRFVDQIIAEYYDWNYYRVSNYSIQHWGFAETDEFIFFMQNRPNDDNPNQSSQFVMRLGYDDLTDELLLEEYLDASKAGFDQCEVIVDPISGSIICHQWNENIKVFSPTEGLSIIDDTDELSPVTFPNGDLYFYAGREEWVEELGYYTTLLYHINPDGTLESHYIELGERQQLCTEPQGCYNGINVDFYDADGDQLNDWDHWIDLDLDEGDALISNADLELTSLGTFDATRPICEDTWCWWNVFYEILDSDGEVVARFENGVQVGNGETIDYGYTYTIDEFVTYEYELAWSSTPQTCDNDTVGCINDIYMVDNSINNYGLWLNTDPDNPVMLEYGDELIDRFVLKDTNSAEYEYTKLVEGDVCPAEFDYCEEYIMVYFYDIDGTKMNEQWDNNILVQVPGGEAIPLYIEYTITDDSTTTLEEGKCTTSDGCWKYYDIDGNMLSAYYEQGEYMYATITGVEKNEVLSETLESQVCNKTNGCSLGEEMTYTIVDPDGNVLYTFVNSWPWADWGEQLPYRVTAVYDPDDDTASDVEAIFRYESTQDIRTCNDASCGRWVDFVIATDVEWEHDWLGSTYMTFEQDEQMIQRIIFPENVTPTATQTQNTCQWEEGCQLNTENFQIFDADGNEFFVNDEWWTPSLPVYFAQGDVMPVNNDFEAVFEISNIEYQMRRLYVYDFIWNLNNVVILDENLYLIERDSWSEGTDNVILRYDEVNGRYQAMYTNLSAVTEITKLGDSYVAINDNETAIIKFTFDATQSTQNYYFFLEENLTEGLSIFGVNDLIVDYDGSIYFKGVNNFIQDITGTIAEDGTVTLDTEVVEREVIRLRPIN